MPEGTTPVGTTVTLPVGTEAVEDGTTTTAEEDEEEEEAAAEEEATEEGVATAELLALALLLSGQAVKVGWHWVTVTTCLVVEVTLSVAVESCAAARVAKRATGVAKRILMDLLSLDLSLELSLLETTEVGRTET